MTRKNNKHAGGIFSSKQETVLDLLVAGKTQAEAARLTGTDPATISRWMKNILFKAELQRRRAETIEKIRGVLEETVLSALVALQEGFADKDVSGAVRLQTAAVFLGKTLPGLLHPETEEFQDILKAEALRRQEMIADSITIGTDTVIEEAERELKETE